MHICDTKWCIVVYKTGWCIVGCVWQVNWIQDLIAVVLTAGVEHRWGRGRGLAGIFFVAWK